MSVLKNHSSNSNINGIDLPQLQHNDAALQHAIDYVREFKAQAATYHLLKTEESLVQLQRTIALLGTKIHCFTPAHLELAKFFLDLHALMGALDGDNDVLWACVGLLQHCSRNLETRRAIVEQYCYVPLLSYLLKRTARPDRVRRLLVLLQDLTYGIRIAWEEPYLVVLLEYLVDMVHQAECDAGEPMDTDVENSHALLALSILVNLCYKNFVALFLFLRTVNISSFSRRIQGFGLLAYKMLIILSEDVHAFEQRELHMFLRTAFASMDNCLVLWNVPQLRHIVDFLLDSQCHEGLHHAMLTHTHYCEDIERVLDQIDARRDVNDSNEDTRKHQQICMELVFKIISYVLQLSLDSKSNNIISLDAITPRIYELLCNWLDAELCGVAAIELLSMLLHVDLRCTIAQLIAREPSTVVKLVASAERADSKPAHVTSILRLLLTLLREPKTEKLVLSKISESYFDKILAAPLALKPEFLSKQAISQQEIDKSIFCLLLLINFASIAKKAYFDKCCALLELPQLQYALARAMLGGSEQVAAAVFQIAQFEHFPRAAVSKLVAEISCMQNATQPASSSQTDMEQWRNLNTILKNHRIFIDKEQTQRVGALIDSISLTLQNNDLQQAPVSQIIELYNHRIESLNCGIHNMQQSLEQASSQVSSLTQLNNVQNAELERFQSKNFELFISQERLQTQIKDLKQQTNELKSNMTNLLKQFSENSEQLQAKDRRLAVKTAEMKELQKNYEDLEALTKDNSTRIDKLKKTVIALEQGIKEKARCLEERERELAKTHKALEEQREARKKSEDLVSVLETQLQEKKLQIENLETEQKETEDLRKTIMSLMESKKPKRKA